MKNTRFAEVRKLVSYLTREWQKRLAITWVNIEHSFVEGTHPEDGSVLADTTASSLWEYRTAKINWYLGTLVRIDDESIEETVVHELVHVILAPMERHIDDEHMEQREFAVESMTRAILNAVK